MSARATCWLVIVATALCASLAEAATWHVELDGSGDFTTIQPAVDAAAAGDTIRIGPGRFATFHAIGLPGYTDEVIVHVTKPNLVFIGAGKGVTRIGSVNPYVPYGLAPRVFFSLASNGFALRDLTIENVYVLVLSNAAVNASGCEFVSNDHRIWCVNLQGSSSQIEDCEFVLSNGGFGVTFAGNAHDSTVRNCTFSGTVRCDAIGAASGPQGIAISDCTVQNGRIAFYAATGSISRCTLSCTNTSALYIDQPSSYVTMTDVTVLGAPVGLQVASGRCTAERLILLGTTSDGIRTTGLSQVSVHDSTIMPASGWAVYCNVAPSWPAHALDLTNNNWGVTDAAAIDAMIWDHRDDPSNPCTVLYEPYVGQPISVESTSWGSLKALWR